MSDSSAQLLEEPGNLSVNIAARNRLEDRVLEETQITSMNQLATLVEAVARRAALESGACGDQDTAEELFSSSLTISESLRMLHELIQTLRKPKLAQRASFGPYLEKLAGFEDFIQLCTRLLAGLWRESFMIEAGTKHPGDNVSRVQGRGYPVDLPRDAIDFCIELIGRTPQCE